MEAWLFQGEEGKRCQEYAGQSDRNERLTPAIVRIEPPDYREADNYTHRRGHHVRRHRPRSRPTIEILRNKGLGGRNASSNACRYANANNQQLKEVGGEPTECEGTAPYQGRAGKKRH